MFMAMSFIVINIQYGIPFPHSQKTPQTSKQPPPKTKNKPRIPPATLILLTKIVYKILPLNQKEKRKRER